MVKLSDYLGTLLSEITRARVEADMTAYQVAQHYGRDEILKNFPVPHVRVKSVDVTVPLVVDGVDEKTLEEYRKPLDPDAVRRAAEDAVADTLKRHQLAAPKQLAGLRTLSAERIRLATREPTLPYRTKTRVMTVSSIDTRRVAEDHAAEVVETLKAAPTEGKKAVDYDALEREIKDEVEFRLVQLKPPPPVMDVEIKTGAIRETADRDTLTYLTFTIYEEAFEWARYEDSEGKERSKLVRE